MPLDEEPIDRYVNRPLARWVASLLQPTPVTANQVSAVAGMFGVCAGAAIGWGTATSLCAAAGLLWTHLVLDCADGELARRRGGGGRTGQVVDGIADYLVAIALHVGLWVLLLKNPAFHSVPFWGIGLLTAAAGFSMAIHSAIFDAMKQRFRNSMGKGGLWLDSPETIREELAKASTSRERFVLRLYRLYAGSQRRLAGWVGEGGGTSQAGFLAWCLIGPTLRVTVYAGAFLLSIRIPVALAIYPAFAVIVGNALLLSMILIGRARAATKS